VVEKSSNKTQLKIMEGVRWGNSPSKSMYAIGFSNYSGKKKIVTVGKSHLHIQLQNKGFRKYLNQLHSSPASEPQ
jgi:hypothetical protein